MISGILWRSKIASLVLHYFSDSCLFLCRLPCYDCLTEALLNNTGASNSFCQKLTSAFSSCPQPVSICVIPRVSGGTSHLPSHNLWLLCPNCVPIRYLPVSPVDNLLAFSPSSFLCGFHIDIGGSFWKDWMTLPTEKYYTYQTRLSNIPVRFLFSAPACSFNSVDPLLTPGLRLPLFHPIGWINAL